MVAAAREIDWDRVPGLLEVEGFGLGLSRSLAADRFQQRVSNLFPIGFRV